MPGRRGIAFTPVHTDIDLLVRAALLAEELGYEVVAVPEAWTIDSTVALAAMAVRTTRITIATAILSVWGRTAGTIAMSAATLQELSQGRYVLGLGASTPTLAEGFHDVPFDRPAAKLRDTTTAVRLLLEGGRVPLTIPTDQRSLRLGFQPPAPVPIWHGTVGPRSLEVTAQTADGWIPSWVSRRAIGPMAAELNALRQVANPDAAPLVTVAGPIVKVDDDTEAARAAAGATVAWYLCSMGDLHPRFIAGQGYEEEVRAVQAANPRLTPMSGIIPPEASSLLDDFAVAGEPDFVREQLAVWDSALDITIVGMPPAGSPWADYERTIRACAP